MRFNGLLIERFWPYVFTLVGVGIWYHWGELRFPTRPESLLSATGTTAAVLVGFLSTAKAIVLGIASTPVLRKLQESGYSSVLFNYIHEATLAGIALLFISMFGFFVCDAPAIPNWFKVIWMVAAILSTLLFVRFTQLLFKLLSKV